MLLVRRIIELLRLASIFFVLFASHPSPAYDMPRAEPFYLLVLAIPSAYGYDVPLNTHKVDFWDTNQMVGHPERPSPRAHHSITYLQGMLFIFGGVGEDGNVLDDAHFYDSHTKRWSGEIAREWCCDERGAVVDVERGYQPPVARAFHAAVADDQAGRLFVLGGYNDEAEELDDIQYFDPAEMKWSGPLLRVAGPLPAARSGHIAFLGPTRSGGIASIYMFGGYSSIGGHLNDLHKLSLRDDHFQWSEVSTSKRVTTTLSGGGDITANGNSQYGAGGSLQGNNAPPRPSPRRHATVTVLPPSSETFPSTSSRSVIIFGGMRGSTADTGGGGNYTGGDAVVFGDVWRLELAGDRAAWEELEVEEGGGNLPRFHHCCVASPDGTRLLATGGRSPLPWPSSNNPPFQITTTTPDYYNVHETSAPGHTFHVGMKSWTPDRQDAYLANSDACRSRLSVPGATPFVLSRDLLNSREEVVGESLLGSSQTLSLPTDRFGHATAIQGSVMFEFGGYGVDNNLVDTEAVLLEAMMRVSYLTEGRDGALCPVLVETV